MSALKHVPQFGQTFIETGLGHGESLSNVIRDGKFSRIHSIEVDPKLVAFGRHRFKRDPRVLIHEGRSTEFLPRLCRPEDETVFWLDAHWAAGIYSHNVQRDTTLSKPCALLEELELILAVPWVVAPTILIDDAQLLMEEEYEWPQSVYDRSAFPSLGMVRRLLKGYQVMVLGAGVDRYLYAFKEGE